VICLISKESVAVMKEYNDNNIIEDTKVNIRTT